MNVDARLKACRFVREKVESVGRTVHAVLRGADGGCGRQWGADRAGGHGGNVGSDDRLNPTIQREGNGAHAPNPDAEPDPAANVRHGDKKNDDENAECHAADDGPELVGLAKDPAADDSADHDVRTKD
jgi:hypothetical protein